jgi:hypothetical protein
LWTICPGWPWTMILLISVSQVTRTTAMSHRRLANSNHFTILHYTLKYTQFKKH